MSEERANALRLVYLAHEGMVQTNLDAILISIHWRLLAHGFKCAKMEKKSQEVLPQQVFDQQKDKVVKYKKGRKRFTLRMFGINRNKAEAVLYQTNSREYNTGSTMQFRGLRARANLVKADHHPIKVVAKINDMSDTIDVALIYQHLPYNDHHDSNLTDTTESSSSSSSETFSSESSASPPRMPPMPEGVRPPDFIGPKPPPGPVDHLLQRYTTDQAKDATYISALHPLNA